MKDRNSVVVEEYLQMIFSLSAENKPIKSIELSKRMNSSPSTVHATLSRLKRDDLVELNKKKEIQLTENGFQQAESLVRRHRLVETFLCDKLGISWHEVHHHAHYLEHGLTPLVEDKLAVFLDFPDTCPHGTPIPGGDVKLPKGTRPLDEFADGDEVEIVIVNEILEESVELMKFLQDKSIQPGKHHRILEKTNITKTIVLQSKESTATLTFDIAGKIGAVPRD